MSRLEILSKNLVAVKERISASSKGRNVTLVAVSKLKPASDIKTCFDLGQLDFGENYLPSEVRWHFIGALQSNKIKLLAQVTNLYAIHSIESQKHADMVDKAFIGRDPKLKLFVQVNTSKEDTKHGAGLDESVALARHIKKNCKNVEFAGFMTIGLPDRDPNERPNPDFLQMAKCKELLQEDCELSMGMSSDFEHAIEMGSFCVRVGSLIFGEREKKK